MPEAETLNVVVKRQKTHGSGQQQASAMPSKLLREDQQELLHSKPPSASNPTMSRTTPAQGVPAKGRRRFMADMKDAVNACQEGFEVQSLRVERESLPFEM